LLEIQQVINTNLRKDRKPWGNSYFINLYNAYNLAAFTQFNHSA